jgi:DNA helicase HerA-like ATPase
MSEGHAGSRGVRTENEVVGVVVDNATPSIVKFVSRNPPPVADYVLVEHSSGFVLGFVEAVGTRSLTLSAMQSIYDPIVLERLFSGGSDNDVYFECVARLLGDLERLELPRLPPLPGSRVYRAPSDLLRRIFGGQEPYKIRIGRLASRTDVPVYVNVNMLVTRHLAVLAVTGAGKSNTVAIIADRLVRIGATILIFDFHGEYVNSTIGEGRLNIIEPKLNPWMLSVQEIMTLLGVERRFYNQERVLRKALRSLRERNEHRSDFLDELVEELEKITSKARLRREESSAAIALQNKVDNLKERYGEIIDDAAVDLVSRLRFGYVNVVDLSRLDRDAADVIVSHMLRVILQERKQHRLLGKSRIPVPILVVVEEAHIIAPRDEDTLSKYWLARIAREGRKFGIGLTIVSQRPKNVDQDILSQANNMIILRIVEPSDQKYIQAASERLSDDLLAHLPSLNIGEAIVVGPMIVLPALVKIDKFEGKFGGSDIDVVAEWVKSTVTDSDENVVEDPWSSIL